MNADERDVIASQNLESRCFLEQATTPVAAR